MSEDARLVSSIAASATAIIRQVGFVEAFMNQLSHESFSADERSECLSKLETIKNSARDIQDLFQSKQVK